MSHHKCPNCISPCKRGTKNESVVLIIIVDGTGNVRDISDGDPVSEFNDAECLRDIDVVLIECRADGSIKRNAPYSWSLMRELVTTSVRLAPEDL